MGQVISMFEYASIREAPKLTALHPAYDEDVLGGSIDRAALVRKHVVEALDIYKRRVQAQSLGS